MTTTTLISLSPDDLEAMLSRAIAEAVRSVDQKAGIRKHAYTVAEVAELIGYSKRKVLEFIKNGRKDKRGLMRILPKKEITTGEYRVLPTDLDKWLSKF